MTQAGIPLLVLDAWEHAYYLQYENRKGEFFHAIWNVWNWQDVSSRFEAAKKLDLQLSASRDCKLDAVRLGRPSFRRNSAKIHAPRRIAECPHSPSSEPEATCPGAPTPTTISPRHGHDRRVDPAANGHRQRHYAPEGVGASDLALEAAKRALAAAKLAPEDIDYILFATMTPDYMFPGSAPCSARSSASRASPRSTSASSARR